MKQRDEFDLIISEALAGYTEAEPLAGLEERVLRRVQQRVEHRRVFLWRWSLATAVAAALAIAIWIGAGVVHRRPSSTIVAEKGATAPEARQSLQVRSVPRTTTELSRPLPGAPTALPSAGIPGFRVSSKTRQFPTPAPLTANEHALLALANADPQALRGLPQSGQSIAISPIEIKPLGEQEADSVGEN